MKRILSILFLFIFYASSFAQSNKQLPADWIDVTTKGVKADSTNGAGNAVIIDSILTHCAIHATLYFPTLAAGSKWRIDGRIVVNKAVTFRFGNDGQFEGTSVYGGGGYINAIYHNSATDTLFFITTGGVAFINAQIYNSSASTTPSGTGIYFQSAVQSKLYGCNFSGFGIDVDIKSGGSFKIHDCLFIDGHITQLKIADTVNSDAGDGEIINSSFISATTISTGSLALLTYISGGGLTITKCKFNAVGGLVPNCIYCPTVGDLDLIISQCGFEQYTTHAFWMQISATGGSQFNNIVFENNYMDGHGHGGHVLLDGSQLSGNSHLFAGNISGNIFTSPDFLDTCIVLNSVSGIYVGANTPWNNKIGLISINNPYSVNNVYNFPDNYVAASLSGNTITCDLFKGTTFGVVLTGSDTLRFTPGSLVGLDNITSGSTGTRFKILVGQDGTGGRGLFVQSTYGENYLNGYYTFASVQIDKRPGKISIVEGYINTNGYCSITNVIFYGSYDHNWVGLITPTVTAKNGAGSSPTISLVAPSGDKAGLVSLLVGTTPAADDTVCVITFANGAAVSQSYPAIFQVGASVRLTPANQAAIDLGGTVNVYAKCTVSGIYIFSNDVALPAGTYLWSYEVTGQ